RAAPPGGRASPLGRGRARPPPPAAPRFGPAPEEPPAAARVPAGSSATFTFSAQGEPGQDVLRTSPALLAGVRAGDIRRVGFTSLGSANWELAGYEVRINDKPFLDNRAVNRKAKDAQRQAQARLAELGLKSGPLEKERADLRALAKTGLARAADKKRLREVETALATLAPAKTRLQRQLKGQHPWHGDPVPRAPTAAGDRPPIRSARVTVVTDTHALADTRNYVYFRTGGHAYLIGGPQWPLTGAAGAQVFAL